jgi:hypothetical protein
MLRLQRSDHDPRADRTDHSVCGCAALSNSVCSTRRKWTLYTGGIRWVEYAAIRCTVAPNSGAGARSETGARTAAAPSP